MKTDAHAGHGHGPHRFDRAFAVGIEGWHGWASQSLALIADAGHNLSDVAGLVLPGPA